MSNPTTPACPHCGSQQLIAHHNSRMVYINHDGERIPLLTANYSLDHPVIEAHSTTYTCSCSWVGNGADLVSHG